VSCTEGCEALGGFFEECLAAPMDHGTAGAKPWIVHTSGAGLTRVSPVRGRLKSMINIIAPLTMKSSSSANTGCWRPARPV